MDNDHVVVVSMLSIDQNTIRSIGTHHMGSDKMTLCPLC